MRSRIPVGDLGAVVAVLTLLITVVWSGKQLGCSATFEPLEDDDSAADDDSAPADDDADDDSADDPERGGSQDGYVDVELVVELDPYADDYGATGGCSCSSVPWRDRRRSRR